MPIAGGRDADEVRAVLEPWLARQLDDGGAEAVSAVEIVDLEVPQSSGYSNETFLLTARWAEADKIVDADLVLRSQPQTYALFPEIDLIEQQYTTMKLLGEHSDVPMATMRWAEPDPAVLGQPFFVMDRLVGQVPADAPPYTVEGFVVEMAADERHEWHRNAIETMTRVGRVDWRDAGFGYLDRSHHGPLGPAQRRGYLGHYLEWANGGQAHPVANPTWQWLTANWPDDGEHIQLCWGDARPGNQMFRGTQVIGVFDWEMVSLGNPESDLGWWLFLQRYMTDGTEVPLLDGMLDRDETIAYWEELMDRPATHVDFYERLSGFQFVLVMIKLAEMLEIPDLAIHNPVADLTAGLVGLR